MCSTNLKSDGAHERLCHRGGIVGGRLTSSEVAALCVELERVWTRFEIGGRCSAIVDMPLPMLKEARPNASARSGRTDVQALDCCAVNLDPADDGSSRLCDPDVVDRNGLDRALSSRVLRRSPPIGLGEAVLVGEAHDCVTSDREEIICVCGTSAANQEILHHNLCRITSH